MFGLCAATAVAACPAAHDIEFLDEDVNWGVAGSGEFDADFSTDKCEQFWAEATFHNTTGQGQNFSFTLTGVTGFGVAGALLGTLTNANVPPGDRTLTIGDEDHPIPNAVTSNGRLGHVRTTSTSTPTMKVDIRIHMVEPREGYNNAGESFDTAVLVGNNDTIHLTMRGIGVPYAYSKIVLPPNGQLSISGSLTNATPAGNFSATIYNAAQQGLGSIVNTVTLPVNQTVPFTSKTPSFANTGTASATYYIRWMHGSTTYNALMPASDITFQVITPTLTMTPSNPTRGSSVTFKVDDVPNGVAVSNWKYVTQTNGTVDRGTTIAGTWLGVIVDSGTATVTVNGIPLSPMQVQVAPRPGWTFQTVAPQPEDWGFVPPSNPGSPSNPAMVPPNPPDGTGFVGGESDLYQGWTSVQPGMTSLVTGGPNDGFRYITNPIDNVNGLVPTAYYWVLAPDLVDPTKPFYMNQDGSYPASATGCILNTDLLANTIRHEVDPDRESHYLNYVLAQTSQAFNVGTTAESFVRSGEDANTFANDAMMALQANATYILSTTTAHSPGTPGHPYPINYDAFGNYLGRVNFASNYTSCP